MAPSINREADPSNVTHDYWLFAERKHGHYPAPTPRSGKWLLFVPVTDVDRVWNEIKRATEEGLLGSESKVATAKDRPTASSKDVRVICVYTYDWTDQADVRRIRAALRELGITRKIPYKTDEDTENGKYRVTGHTRISKYFE